VAFVEDLDSFERDFPVDGKALSTHEYFQGGVNAEFVQVIAPQHLRVRVWERGAGPTLACGTGACAAVVASVLMKLTLKDHPCKVTLPGGDLIICWREADQRLSLSGPAKFVYEGSLPLPPLPHRR
jgi:diaminopimelate epimerase